MTASAASGTGRRVRRSLTSSTPSSRPMPRTSPTSSCRGGAPVVRVLAESIERRSPNQIDWAPTLASLLGVSLPAAEGVDLLADLATSGEVDQNASR
jgi:hypothetical protein